MLHICATLVHLNMQLVNINQYIWLRKKTGELHEFLKAKGRSHIGYDKVAFQNIVVNNVLWDGFWNESMVVDDLWNTV